MLYTSIDAALADGRLEQPELVATVVAKLNALGTTKDEAMAQVMALVHPDGVRTREGLKPRMAAALLWDMARNYGHIIIDEKGFDVASHQAGVLAPYLP